MGNQRDRTGIDIGGGGGMGVDNVSGDGCCGDDAIIDKDGVVDDDDDDEGVTKACAEAPFITGPTVTQSARAANNGRGTIMRTAIRWMLDDEEEQ